MEQQPQRQPEDERIAEPVRPDAVDGEATETEPELQPRIYVASLTDYNEGRLHGTWLDAAQEPEDLQDGIQGMLMASPSGHAEEWAIHDFEGFNGLHLGEWEDLEHVSRVAKGIRDNGIAFAHWATFAATDEELDKFEDSYLGHWPSLADYAHDIFESSGMQDRLNKEAPDFLQPYVRIDASAFGRDLLLGGDIVAAEGDGGVYVFNGRW